MLRPLALALLIAWLSLAAAAAPAETPARRLVSLNPSLTAIALALGARDALVGVDDFSARQRPEVADLPTVGGLFSPSLEAVVSLRPDRVVLVPSVEQRDFRQRLEALGVPVSVFENRHFDQVLENIRRLGRILGREAAATRRIEAIQRARSGASHAARGRARPRVLVVVQRDPLFVVGGDNFIDEMLAAVGARNAAAQFEGPYPRVSVEWLVATAPEVLLDASPEPGASESFWARWPSLPAVASGRVWRLSAMATLPGPDLDRALRALSEAVYRLPAVPVLAVAADDAGAATSAPAAGAPARRGGLRP